MRAARLAGFFLAVFLTAAGSVWADDPVHKIGRGATNILTAWLELPQEIQQDYQHSGWRGIGVGAVRGVLCTFLRLGCGAYDIISAPFFTESAYGRFDMALYPWHDPNQLQPAQAEPVPAP